ncbi:hypothetical protein HY086_03165 [Candidatus Gottesmanbacteria bacterium]|nr:hypothetical protein [Candidatus Gottesmanbacteria bacterium]
MKKLLIAVGILLLLTLIGIAGYFGYTQVTQSKAASTAQTSTVLPPGFVNPFVEKPKSGFGSTSATTVVAGLFAQPTPTPYQNPFGSTQSASQKYQNPFQTLK